MAGISQRFFRIEVGARVSRGNRRFEITHLLSVNRVLAVDLETKQSESLYIDEIRLLTSEETTASPPAQRDLTQYAPEEWAEAQRRFAAIKPLLENPFRARSEAELIASTYDVHVTTLYRWLKIYTNEGHVSALVPEKRGRKSGQTFLRDEQEKTITSAIEDMYLSKQRHKQADVVEEVQRRCRKAGIDAPHQNTIRKRIAALDPAVSLRRRGFQDKARNQFDPIRGSLPGATHPLSIVQVDHTKADIIVVDEVNRQPIGKPWLTLAIDTYSRMVAGIYLGFEEPSAMSAGMCLAHAICQKREYLAELGVNGEWPVWGLMSVVHTDNGSEFHGSMLRRACENYAIDIHWRAVPKPNWGGHIERLMGTVANELRKLPGTTFSNPTQRKGYDSEAHAALTIRELERHLVDFIVNVYHQRVHSELSMPPKKQWEIGVIGDEHTRGTGIIHVPEDAQRIRLDFLPFFERSVQQYGIQIDNISYYDPVLNPYINTMDPENRKKKRQFIVRRDPRDISKVYFLDPKDNRYSTIPYRNIGLPAISVRELQEAQRLLRERGDSAVDEGTIFAAIDRMRSRVDEAKLKTKAARRQIARRPKGDDPVATPAKTAPVRPAITPLAPGIDDPFTMPITPFDEISLVR